VMMLPAIAYVWLQAEVRRTGRQDAGAQDYHKRMLRKGMVTSAIYAAGIPLTFVTPWLGLACAALVAILWFLPKGPFDRFFAR